MFDSDNVPTKSQLGSIERLWGFWQVNIRFLLSDVLKTSYEPMFTSIESVQIFIQFMT
jgi:hypothetical protein